MKIELFWKWHFIRIPLQNWNACFGI